MGDELKAAIRSWWERAWKKEDAVVVTVIVFFIGGIILTFGAGRRQLGTASLAVSGLTSIVMSETIARVINRIHGTHYTKRFPILWGIAAISFAVAMFSIYHETAGEQLTGAEHPGTVGAWLVTPLPSPFR